MPAGAWSQAHNMEKTGRTHKYCFATADGMRVASAQESFRRRSSQKEEQMEEEVIKEACLVGSEEDRTLVDLDAE